MALITGDKFVAGLLKLGIADDKTERVVIDAKVGEPVRLTIHKFGDDRVLKLCDDGCIMIAHTAAEAGVAR